MLYFKSSDNRLFLTDFTSSNTKEVAVVWTRTGVDRQGVWQAIDPVDYYYKSTLNKFIKKYKLTKLEGDKHWSDSKDLLAKKVGIDKTGVVFNPFCGPKGCVTIEGFFSRTIPSNYAEVKARYSL